MLPKDKSVLILIVVEYGLGDMIVKLFARCRVGVLILIVVEYGLGENIPNIDKEGKPVLILIVVEYGLGV